MFTIVSRVFPDLEIIKFSKFLVFMFFCFFKLKLSLKLKSFLILFLKKLYIDLAPNEDPPIPIKLIFEYFLSLFKNFLLYEYL